MSLKCHFPERIYGGRSAQRAFSLVELLTVITIIVIISAGSTAAISALGKAGSIQKTAYAIGDQISACRATAMAGNTYVWLALAVDDPAPNSVTMISFISKTGQASDITDATKLSLLSKAQVFQNVVLKDGLEIKDSEMVIKTNPVDPEVEDLKDKLKAFSSSLSYAVSGEDIDFNYVIQFSPTGEASLAPNTVSRWVQVGLSPKQGAGDTDNKNIAVLQVSGLTGQVRTFRP
jgi:prepilin-type N-terminal cleavage/methylation domain-containing protein